MPNVSVDSTSCSSQASSVRHVFPVCHEVRRCICFVATLVSLVTAARAPPPLASAETIVIHFASAMLEIETLIHLLDDLFLIKLFAVRLVIIVSTRVQLETSFAELGLTLKQCEDQGLQERSLLLPKEFDENRRNCIFLTTDDWVFPVVLVRTIFLNVCMEINNPAWSGFHVVAVIIFITQIIRNAK